MVLLCLIGSLAVVVGCRGRPIEGDLPGVYTVTYDYGIQQLTLHADGTYEQAFAENGKSFVSLNRDRWTVQQADFWNGKLLVLQNPVMVDNGFGERADMKKVDGLWQLRIRRSWPGRVRLLINEEAGLSFEKRT